jgi:RsiW-degrading membrane proteinase PrsW (M82 family)
MEILKLLALALGPGISVCLYVYWRDKFEKEPLGLIVKCFMFGIVALVPAVALEFLGNQLGFGVSRDAVMTLFFTFVVIGGSEEFSKFLVLRYYAYRKSDFNEPYDGITYSIMISMGFASAENVVYVFGGSTSEGVDTALIRMFTAIPAHAIFAILMGYFVGLAKFKMGNHFLSITGLLAAAAFHGAYDFFLMYKIHPAMIVGAGVSLLIGVYLSHRAIKMHQDNSPFRDPLIGDGPSDILP